MSDQELVERLRAGSEDAFDAIFREHYSFLVGLVQSMLRDRAIAEEIAQDVMLELWRRRGTIVVEASLRAYLFRAARNRALNHIRHERVAQRAAPLVADEPSAPPSAEHALADAEIDRAVHAALEQLPPRCRQVFELSRIHNLKYTEIAHTLDISVKTVEAQMGKALRMLRESLASWLPEAEE